MTLFDISNTLLDLESSQAKLRIALDRFAELCSQITNVQPDPSYTAWANDTYLNDGVAINPEAAAYCIKDYQRSVVFIRGVHDALNTLCHRPTETKPTRVLYAGCGPFATLLLPTLHRFRPTDLDIHLVDIHQQSLDSVAKLIKQFGLTEFNITLTQADACTYQHKGTLDLVIAETMQKALEQEPQVAVTHNLAGQLANNGILIPERITVTLALGNLVAETQHYQTNGTLDIEQLIQTGERQIVDTLIDLSKDTRGALLSGFVHANTKALPFIPLGTITIPSHKQLRNVQALLLTTIRVYGTHILDDYACSLTLPSRCVDLEPLQAGAQYQAIYSLGTYPKIDWLTS